MSQKCTDTPSTKAKPEKGIAQLKEAVSDTASAKVKAEKGISQLKDSVSGLAKKASDAITKASPIQQLVAGTVSGWATGNLSGRVGKVGALTAGGGILLFQIAQHQKLTKMDWDKVKEQAEKSYKGVNTKYCTQLMQNASKFGRSNRFFAAGFIGGFLIGLAT